MENLLKQMKKDPELQVSEEEMEAWANEIAEKGYHYLEGKTYDILEKEKADALCDYSDEVRSKWLELLQHYRLVYDIQDLIPHQHIRWISWSKKRPAVETDPQYGNELHSGGIFTSLRFTNTCMLCNVMFNFQKKRQGMVSFNKTLVFQKISVEEHMVLTIGWANEFIPQSTS